MEKTFIENEQSKVEITNVFEKTDEASSLFTNISDEVVKAYTSDLDKLLLKIKENAVENTPSDNILEKLVMELSNILYFMGTRLESVGIKDDITKLSAKEVYNNSYTNNLTNVGDQKKKPTVAELTVMAENDSRYQTVVNNIYSRVYRQIKYKIDAAYEMLSSLRKIISKRMQENQLDYTRNTGSVVVGSEEF
nr:MAG TPA: Phosphoribosyl-ATP pyrophosphatase [Caudoviricetes sp.]